MSHRKRLGTAIGIVAAGLALSTLPTSAASAASYEYSGLTYWCDGNWITGWSCYNALQKCGAEGKRLDRASTQIIGYQCRGVYVVNVVTRYQLWLNTK